MYSRRLDRLTPYVPGEQPRDRRYIKLNTNENPYPPSPRVKEALAGYDSERLRLYPDPLFTELRQTAAVRHSLSPENVFAGNGSDEILSFAFYAYFESRVAFAKPSYSFYPVYCDYYGIDPVTVPLDNDYGIDLGSFLNNDEVDGVVIANPNSPTGAYIESADIAAFLERYPRDRVVVIDEAYIAFGGESCAPLVGRFENLLVVQTLSKEASLAGLRLGIAYGDSGLIRGLFRAKDAFNSYPVHDIAQRLGIAALEDERYSREVCAKIVATRERVATSLVEHGWFVVPSKANFLFARNPRVSGEEVYRSLRDRGILVRHFSSPDLTDFVRISIGTDDEMDQFLREATRGGV
jgi:histidinol-phosphate aminotransferase